MTRRPRHVIVGAGTAGCLYAARLAAATDHELVLVEAGPDLRPGVDPIIDGPDPIAASRIPERQWLEPIVIPGRDPARTDPARTDPARTDPARTDPARTGPARTNRAATGHPGARSYARGRTVGGSAAINGGLLTEPSKADHARWVAAGAGELWSWDACATARAALRSTVRSVRHARPSWAEVHAVVSDLAMARGVPWVVTPSAVASGVGPATLARDPVSGRRWTTLDVLEPFRSPGSRRVEVRAGIEVDRLLWGAGSRVEGVRAADGTVVEADLVTLCSGTFGSATLLLRSGIETVAGDTGVGRGITDHPSVSMSLPLTDSSRRGRTGGAPGPSPRDSSGPLRCLWRAGALQLLPMSSSGPGEGERATAAVLLALMRPRSTGHLRLDDEGRAVVDLGSYGDADGADLQTMRRGVRLLLDLAEAPRLRRVADGAWFGDGATPPEHVNGLLGEPDALRTWLLGQHGRHVHATSGCAMGSVVDATGRVTTEDAQVLPGLRIADLSVLPDVATANPMWSAMLVAERIAELVAVTS